MNIKSHLLSYFTNRWGMFEYTRGWLKGNCPECGAENKFGVNIGTNRVHCFRCDFRNTPIFTVSLIEKVTIPAAYNIIKAFDGYEFYESSPIVYERTPVILPEGYRRLSSGTSQIARSARNYIEKKRGLDVAKLSSKGFGYCDSGKLFGYIIMPFYVKGKLVYYQTRNFMANGPKFNNPKIEDFGIGKSNLIYNIDSLWLYYNVNIVESVFNAETIGDNTIALSGKSISEWQWTTILSSPVKRVTIILDPDAYYTKALPLALQLSSYKLVKIVNLPDNQDVNSYGRTRTMLIKRREAYKSYNELLKMKHEYERSRNTY